MPRQYWFDESHLPLPWMDHRAGFRPSAYDWRLAREILLRVARGQTIKAIAFDEQMPSYATIFHWLKMRPDFGSEYRALRAELREEARERAARRVRDRVKLAQVKAQVAGKRWWRRGPPSSFTPAIGRKICARLARGTTMSAVNATPGFPSAKVVYRWLKTEPAFAAMVGEAREKNIWRLRMAADMEADKALEVATWEQFRKVKRKVARIEGRMGRLTPKVWG